MRPPESSSAAGVRRRGERQASPLSGLCVCSGWPSRSNSVSRNHKAADIDDGPVVTFDVQFGPGRIPPLRAVVGDGEDIAAEHVGEGHRVRVPACASALCAASFAASRSAWLVPWVPPIRLAYQLCQPGGRTPTLGRG